MAIVYEKCHYHNSTRASLNSNFNFDARINEYLKTSVDGQYDEITTATATASETTSTWLLLVCDSKSDVDDVFRSPFLLKEVNILRDYHFSGIFSLKCLFLGAWAFRIPRPFRLTRTTYHFCCPLWSTVLYKNNIFNLGWIPWLEHDLLLYNIITCFLFP